MLSPLLTLIEKDLNFMASSAEFQRDLGRSGGEVRPGRATLHIQLPVRIERVEQDLAYRLKS